MEKRLRAELRPLLRPAVEHDVELPEVVSVMMAQLRDNKVCVPCCAYTSCDGMLVAYLYTMALLDIEDYDVCIHDYVCLQMHF